MARIRHIAMHCEHQEEIAAFYSTIFGLTEVLRHGSVQSNGREAIYLSDGALNLAILPGGPGRQGLDHFGFQVDDINATSVAALAAGARRGATAVPQDGRKNEAFITDPTDQRIDISARGWDYGGATTSRINRLTLVANDPSKLAEFYERAFGMHALSRGSGPDASYTLSDGYVEMSIVANQAPGAVGSRTGIKQFGFEVDDVAASLAAALSAGGKPTSDADGGGFIDPQGQRIDLAQRGMALAR